MPSEVRARGVSKRYGDLPAVESVDVEIGPGITALIGPNGAGKTTLLRLLSGTLAPSAGEVEPPARFAYVDQDLALDPEMTGDETLRLFAALYRVPVGDLAERFGISALLPRLVQTWSGGQKRRLHLAAALLHSPEVIFLDEPTAGLDGEGARLLWAELDRRAEAGATVVVVGHDLDEIEREAASVLLLDRGRIAARGTPAELVAAHGRTWLRVTLKERPADQAALLAALSGFAGVSLDGRRLWLEADDVGALLRALPVEAADVAVHKRDLASAYRTLTGRELPR